ncbi:UNVERIFIED_CONTAM: hypothetical protein ABIE34_000609 [Jeotgalibacillus campisalis]
MQQTTDAGLGKIDTGSSIVDAPMNVIFFSAPLGEMHKLYGSPPFLDLPCTQALVGMFHVRKGQVPPVLVKGSHAAACCFGIHSNCRRRAETVRKSLADTDAQVLGPGGQCELPALAFPFEIIHDATNLRRSGKSRICLRFAFGPVHSSHP